MRRATIVKRSKFIIFKVLVVEICTSHIFNPLFLLVLLPFQVCDRYAYSGVAFTSAKGLDLDWCKTCDRGLPAPDCIIYLDMPIEEAAKVRLINMPGSSYYCHDLCCVPYIYMQSCNFMS